jgi:hypothetical protein
MNGQIFRAYVQQVLAPTLRPGDMVTWTMYGCTRSRVSDRRCAEALRCGAGLFDARANTVTHRSGGCG